MAESTTMDGTYRDGILATQQQDWAKTWPAQKQALIEAGAPADWLETDAAEQVFRMLTATQTALHIFGAETAFGIVLQTLEMLLREEPPVRFFPRETVVLFRDGIAEYIPASVRLPITDTTDAALFTTRVLVDAVAISARMAA